MTILAPLSAVCIYRAPKIYLEAAMPLTMHASYALSWHRRVWTVSIDFCAFLYMTHVVFVFQMGLHPDWFILLTKYIFWLYFHCSETLDYPSFRIWLCWYVWRFWLSFLLLTSVISAPSVIVLYWTFSSSSSNLKISCHTGLGRSQVTTSNETFSGRSRRYSNLITFQHIPRPQDST